MKHSLKTLPPEIICQISEALMLTHGATTALEVKKELHNQGFFAIQAEVSAMMWVMAEVRHWKFWSDGQYRVYTFAQDTDDTLYHCLAREGEMWEVMVEGKWQVTSASTQGRHPQIDYQEFPSNRHAFAHASGLTIIRESEGFVAADPPGLHLRLRHRFRRVAGQQPASCVLSFREGRQEERFAAWFHLHGQRAAGELTVLKKAGYAFELSGAEAHRVLTRLHDLGRWEVPEATRQQALLLGESEIHRSARLASGEGLGRWSLVGPAETPKAVALSFSPAGLYKVELCYPGQVMLELRYQDWAPEMEWWPLLRWLLDGG